MSPLPSGTPSNDRLRDLLLELQEQLDHINPGVGLPQIAPPSSGERSPVSIKSQAESWIARVRRLPAIKISPHSYRMPGNVDAMVTRLCDRYSVSKGDMVAFLLSHAVATFEPQAPTEHDLPDPIPAPFELEVYSLKGKLARVMSIRPDPADRPLLVVGRRATSDDCPSLTIREDGKLSSRHFLLSGSNKGLRIADLHSTNGTWLSITAEDDISVSSGESFLLISRERTVQLSLDTFDEETGEGRLTLIDDGNDEPRGMPFHLAEGQHLPLGEVMRARRSGDSVTGSNDMAREEESLLVRMHGRLAFLPPAHGIEEVFEGAGQVLFQRLDARGSGESIEPGRYVLAGNSLFRLVRPS